MCVQASAALDEDMGFNWVHAEPSTRPLSASSTPAQTLQLQHLH